MVYGQFKEHIISKLLSKLKRNISNSGIWANTLIYENDLIINKIYEQDLKDNPNQPAEKVYQVIWSDEECGFRKVPYSMPFPETKIDEAFMEVIGTINSQKQ